MPGISVRLPLSIDQSHGPYSLHTRIKPMIKQNLKMLLLTIPGERMMDPNFGVGIQKFLFENDTINLRSRLSERISKQVRRYMPFLKIKDTILPDISEVNSLSSNSLRIQITYSIEDMSEADILNIKLSPYDSSKGVF